MKNDLILILLLMFPFLRMLSLRLEWKINKYLFIDLYLPKDDAKKLKEVLHEQNF